MSRLVVRAAVAALAALGLALSSGTLAEQRASAVVEPVGDIVLAFEPGCQGSGTYEVVNETKGVVQHREAVSWSGSQPIYVVDNSGGIADPGDRLVVRLLSEEGAVLFEAPVPFLDYVIVHEHGLLDFGLPDYLLLVRLDCSTVPYVVSRHLSYNPHRPEPEEPRGPAARPPTGISAAIILAFEPGCQGSGTYEVVNETKGVVQHREAVSWSGSQPIHVVDGSGGIADRGDRLVVRLLGDDGRLLFAAPAQFLDDVIVLQERLPDYLLLVRLDCSTVPYEVTYHLPYDPPALPPVTSTAEPSGGRASPSPVPLLVVLFGLAFAASWRHMRRRSVDRSGVIGTAGRPE